MSFPDMTFAVSPNKSLQPAKWPVILGMRAAAIDKVLMISLGEPLAAELSR